MTKVVEVGVYMDVMWISRGCLLKIIMNQVHTSGIEVKHVVVPGNHPISAGIPE